MFKLKCKEGCKLPAVDITQQIKVAYSRLSLQYSGSHAAFIPPKELCPKQLKPVSAGEEILLLHPPL